MVVAQVLLRHLIQPNYYLNQKENVLKSKKSEDETVTAV